MKSAQAILVSGIFLLSAPSFASSFSLASVRSIECSDQAPSSEIALFFNTDDAAAGTYARRPDTIPYHYGNRRSPFGDSSTGQMTLANDPDTENGTISLEDSWNPNQVSRLVLTPSSTPGEYTGTLSGQVETAAGWENLPAHPMRCEVTFNES